MKHRLFCTVLGLSLMVVTQAQNTRRFRQDLLKHFVSLPYDKPLSSWLQEMAAHPSFRRDTTSKKVAGSQLLLTGKVYLPLLLGIDSAVLAIGKTDFRSSLTINGNTVNASNDTTYFVSQSYHLPDSLFTEKEWKEVCKTLRKSFGRHSSIMYPQSIVKSPVESVWFRTGNSIAPDLTLMFGHLKEQKIYLISYQLSFTTAPAE